MSRSRGASAQPESVTRSFLSSGAPQVVQLVRPVSFWALHHWHSIRPIRTALHYFHAIRPPGRRGVQGEPVTGPAPRRLASEPGVRALAGYAGGGLAGVPHSAQNFAVALRSALQLVQCFAMGVPHSPQNFQPTRTALL